MPEYINEANQVTCWTAKCSDEAAPWIVLIHGLSVDHEVWDFMVPDLQRTHHVMTIDLPDHGGNATPFTVEDAVQELKICMDGLSIQKAVILGHCIGGIVAQVFAQKHPDRCSRLILMDTFPVGQRDIDYASFKWLSRLRKPMMLIQATLFFNALSSIFAATAQGEVFLYLMMSQQKPSKIFHAFTEAMQSLSKYPPATLTCPVYYLMGSRDHLEPIHTWNRKAAKQVGGHYITIKHCGHFPMVDNPELVIKTVLNCLGP